MLRVATEAAKDNPVDGLPKMAAILVCRNGKTYIGYNQRKTHPLQKEFARNEHSIHLHAEIDAIVKATRDGSPVDGGTMYVARVWRNGSPALAKPCSGCQKAIIHFDIAHVEWTK